MEHFDLACVFLEEFRPFSDISIIPDQELRFH